MKLKYRKPSIMTDKAIAFVTNGFLILLIIILAALFSGCTITKDIKDIKETVIRIEDYVR